MNDSMMTSVTVGVVFAVFAVWMQRHQRWGYFVNGLTGRYVITGSRGGSHTAAPSAGGTTPSTPTGPGGKPLGPPLKISEM